jgi:hypothetical protein
MVVSQAGRVSRVIVVRYESRVVRWNENFQTVMTRALSYVNATSYHHTKLQATAQSKRRAIAAGREHHSGHCRRGS